MNAQRDVVVVALGGDAPDLSTVRAFLAAGTQGEGYRPGVWHHPLVALDTPIDFTCFVWEDGTAEDCDVRPLDRDAVTVSLPSLVSRQTL